ncbi:hypothetical protein BDP55DRAFT_649624 [Colletotrichum godetiae]|uniref:Uncharacterized protein n=1 Tax=Colletotrichum godetiae TaxID=1209918 RepID=A0AAJ0AVK2_9PEZI|nr:uncharacterized protein BDP55DRAFT_649624 [Colletotrichum godetiae]KAK1691125.1 hypothetical protein BDP55DRAFT_649624 [Colletotrichum godetiae]
MPLLYGEGEKAFFRLQEELIKKSDDESIFSWGFGEPARFVGGLFARSPADFFCTSTCQAHTREHIAIPTDPAQRAMGVGRQDRVGWRSAQCFME